MDAEQIARVALRIGPFRGRVLVVTWGHTYRLLVPQGERRAGIGRQPPQPSNRRSAKHEHLPYESKGYSPEEDPAEQGLPHTSPDVIKRSASEQGLRGSPQHTRRKRS
ncbi:MAG: hypothetical protein ACT4O1_06880 [Gemmatimonadota bacterium]